MAYAIVDAQGHYGAYTRVERVFETLAQADAYARAGRRAVIEGDFSVGERVHSTDAQRYELRANAERDMALAVAETKAHRASR